MADRAAGAASATQIDPGLVARVSGALRYALTGKAPDTWFGPMDPLPPVAQEQAVGRQFDYVPGANLQTTPRAGEPITFGQLRALADNHDVLRAIIETRKDQLSKIPWTVKQRDGNEDTPQAKAIIAALGKPDREHNFATWTRMLLEDMLVIDAPTIYRRPTKGGATYSLDLVDGSTIKRVIDGTGRTPAAPQKAYQQILKGMPAVDYSTDEMMYAPRNPRAHKLYGFSPVEQIVMTVNIALRRQVSQLEYYTEGNIPEMLIGVPSTWNVDQIAQWQKYWDILTKDMRERRRARFVPGDMKAQLLKTAPLFDEADEWLTRVICFAFSVSPQPFIKQMNRATAATAQEAALQEGLAPLMLWLKGVMDDILGAWFGAPDHEFVWQDEEDIDPLTQAQVDQIYINAGVDLVNEIRDRRGMAPIEGGDQPRQPVQPGAFGTAAAGDEQPGKKTPKGKPEEDTTASEDPGASKVAKFSRRSLRQAAY